MPLSRHDATVAISSAPVSLRLFWIAAALLVAPALAQQPPAPASPPCATAAYRQFDFWVGDWEVHNAAGKRAGENRITHIHGGCALLEEWRGTGNVSGTSLNLYDQERGVWHQTWVDSGGNLLTLEGGFADGAMTLRGRTVQREPAAKTTQHRIGWTPQPDGRVRQLWEMSTDEGKTWSVSFDGWYSRRK
jgi:hypothetical protein